MHGPRRRRRVHGDHPRACCSAVPANLLSPLPSLWSCRRRRRSRRPTSAKLAKALKACHKLSKTKRKRCEATARKRYAKTAQSKTKPKSKHRAGRRASDHECSSSKLRVWRTRARCFVDGAVVLRCCGRRRAVPARPTSVSCPARSVTALNSEGTLETQAGSHPYSYTVAFRYEDRSGRLYRRR